MSTDLQQFQNVSRYRNSAVLLHGLYNSEVLIGVVCGSNVSSPTGLCALTRTCTRSICNLTDGKRIWHQRILVTFDRWSLDPLGHWGWHSCIQLFEKQFSLYRAWKMRMASFGRSTFYTSDWNVQAAHRWTRHLWLISTKIQMWNIGHCV